MKFSQLALVLATLSFTPSAFAGVLQLENSAKQLNGVTISKGGKLVVEGRTTNVITVAAGVRIALFGAVKAYVGEVLVNDDKKFVCDRAKALDSVANLSAISVRVSVTSGLFSKAKLVEALDNGFEANDVNVDGKDIKALMAVVNAGAAPATGAVITFSGEKLTDGSEVVTYEDGKSAAKSIHGSAGFIKAVFSNWLGKTNDSDLEKLISTLTACKIQ